MVLVSKKFRISENAPDVLDITRNVDDTVKGGDTGLELADKFGIKHTFNYPSDYVNPRDVGINVNSDTIPEGGYLNENPPSGYLPNQPNTWTFTNGGYWNGVYYPPGTTPPGYTGGTGGTGGGSSTTQYPDQAKGIITQVKVPTTTNRGLQFQIEIACRNIGGKEGKFNVKIDIPALNIEAAPTASVYLPAFYSGLIRKTLIMPESAPQNQLFPASITLMRVTETSTGQSVPDDVETSTIPGPNTAIPPTPTPNPTTDSYYSLVRKKCDTNTTLYTKEYLESQGITILEYRTNPAELITCTACGCLHGWIVIKITKTSFAHSLLLALGFVEGIVTTGGTTPIPTPTPTPTTARLLGPASVHDGDSFRVTGSGFQPGESVVVKLSLVWRGGKYNGKSYSYSRTATASSSGSISVTLKTEEVPSGVTSTAGILATGNKGSTATWSIKIL